MLKEVIPAILTLDGAELLQKLIVLQARGGQVHIDVMDGQLVPGGTFSLRHNLIPLKETLVGLGSEWHLMVREPLAYLNDLVTIHARRVIIHQESFADEQHLLGAIDTFLAANLAVSVSVWPDHNFWAVLMSRPIGWQIMGVVPGQAGQSMLPDTSSRVETLRQRQLNNAMIISVDGGVNFSSARLLVAAGADRLVMNTAFWEAENPDTQIAQLLKGGHGISSSN